MPTFLQYQDEAFQTAIYPNKGNNIVYPALGLIGEAGEVAEKIKKILRDKNGEWGPGDRAAIVKELGDVLWYLSALCTEFQVDLEYVALTNLEKLQSRQQRNTLQGSGDDR